MNEDIVTRLLKRAEIRRQIPTRKSVQENKPDRIADLLEEAAAEITRERILYTNLMLDLDRVLRGEKTLCDFDIVNQIEAYMESKR